MDYSNLRFEELIAHVRNLQQEGIDGVYLDREEFNKLNINLLDDRRIQYMGVTEKQMKQANFMIIYGMEFRVVESGLFFKNKFRFKGYKEV